VELANSPNLAVQLLVLLALFLILAAVSLRFRAARGKWAIPCILFALCSLQGATLERMIAGYSDRGDDDDFGDPTSTSVDLQRDLRLMWETQRLGGTPDPSHGPNPRSSTDAAICAASRVFNTVKLVGLTRADVIAAVGDPKTSNDSIYNFPFFSVAELSQVLTPFKQRDLGSFPVAAAIHAGRLWWPTLR
jgi:hypothetical protein